MWKNNMKWHANETLGYKTEMLRPRLHPWYTVQCKIVNDNLASYPAYSHHYSDAVCWWAAAAHDALTWKIYTLTLASPVVSNGYTPNCSGHTGLTHSF